MTGRDFLRQWLGTLDEPSLEALLARRDDVLVGTPPRDLAELAQRLWHPHSLVVTLRDSSLPCLQTAEAAWALGHGCTRASLAEFLGDDGPGHRAAVDDVVDELVASAVFCADGPDRLVLPGAFAQIFPDPLGLGQPLAVLLQDRSVDDMRRTQSALGIERQKNRADTVAALLAYFGDAGNVRSLIATAPANVTDYLSVLAAEAAVPDETYNPASYQVRQTAREWAGARMLLVGERWSYDWRMPAEVARALRGPDYRAPFTPRCPGAERRPVDRKRVASNSAAAAAEFANHLLALLDQIARTPLASMKSGGVGTRELARTAKIINADERVVRLALELADEQDLLKHDERTIAVSAEFAAWRNSQPADRLAGALDTWWRIGATPTESRDSDGKARRALARPGDCDGCRAARIVLIDTLAESDGALNRADAARIALWRRPLVHVVSQDDGEPLATVWREAELLGVIADGVLTELGHAVRSGDPGLVAQHATALLPQSADRATFGSDLTAYVAGAPSARVSALLDSVADRESRGGATTWRFSPGSIRRAFDNGSEGEALITSLSDIAAGPLPQPLIYLIGDIDRRHGHLRLSAPITCICSDDAALLAEVAGDRKLARFGLRLLAPTVLTAEAPLPTVLDALRAAGYFPVVDAAEPAAEHAPPTPKPSRAQLRKLYPEPSRADPRQLAGRLLQGANRKTKRETPTEKLLSSLTRSLSIPEIRQLAHAVDTKSRVRIDYVAASGGVSSRVIREPELIGGSLYAWCELRSDDRIFTVTRIQSVAAV